MQGIHATQTCQETSKMPLLSGGQSTISMRGACWHRWHTVWLGWLKEEDSLGVCISFGKPTCHSGSPVWCLWYGAALLYMPQCCYQRWTASSYGHLSFQSVAIWDCIHLLCAWWLLTGQSGVQNHCSAILFLAATCNQLTVSWQCHCRLQCLSDDILMLMGLFRISANKHLLQMSCQWRDLRNRMLLGLGHQDGNDPPSFESMAIFCPACPQPGINLPSDWREQHSAYVIFQTFLFVYLTGFEGMNSFKPS